MQVEEELWEEEFIERCFQEMLEEEEQWEWFIPSRDLPPQTVSQLQEQISLLVLDADVQSDADCEGVVVSSANQEPVLSFLFVLIVFVFLVKRPSSSPPPDEQQSQSQRQGVHPGHPETHHVTPAGSQPCPAPTHCDITTRMSAVFSSRHSTFSLMCCQSCVLACDGVQSLTETL